VLALVRDGQLRLDALMAALDEIMPRVAAGEALKIGPDEYREKMSDFLDDARAQGLMGEPEGLDPDEDAKYDC